MGILNEQFESLIYQAIAQIKIKEQRHFEESTVELINHDFLVALELEVILSDTGSIDISEETAYKLSKIADYNDRVYRSCSKDDYDDEDMYTTIEDDWFEGYEEGNFVRDDSYNYQLWRS